MARAVLLLLFALALCASAFDHGDAASDDAELVGLLQQWASAGDFEYLETSEDQKMSGKDMNVSPGLAIAAANAQQEALELKAKEAAGGNAVLNTAADEGLRPPMQKHETEQEEIADELKCKAASMTWFNAKCWSNEEICEEKQGKFINGECRCELKHRMIDGNREESSELLTQSVPMVDSYASCTHQLCDTRGGDYGWHVWRGNCVCHKMVIAPGAVWPAQTWMEERARALCPHTHEIPHALIGARWEGASTEEQRQFKLQANAILKQLLPGVKNPKDLTGRLQLRKECLAPDEPLQELKVCHELWPTFWDNVDKLMELYAIKADKQIRAAKEDRDVLFSQMITASAEALQHEHVTMKGVEGPHTLKVTTRVEGSIEPRSVLTAEATKGEKLEEHLKAIKSAGAMTDGMGLPASVEEPGEDGESSAKGVDGFVNMGENEFDQAQQSSLDNDSEEAVASLF